MDKFNSKEVKEVFNAYPDNIRKKMMLLRQIVLETAEEIDSIKSIEERKQSRKQRVRGNRGETEGQVFPCHIISAIHIL